MLTYSLYLRLLINKTSINIQPHVIDIANVRVRSRLTILLAFNMTFIINIKVLDYLNMI